MNNLLKSIQQRPVDSFLMGLGVFFIVLFQLERLPGMFNSLWGDEVSYNYAFLSAQHLPHELSKTVCTIMRPILDYALKKWGWFLVLPKTEVAFSLIPWIYSALSLLLILFLRWTPRVEIRLLGVLMLGVCVLETNYSIEAQSYSFISLGSWIFLFCVGLALERLTRQEFRSAFWLFMGGCAVVLNTHFFAWPYVSAVSLLFAIFFIKETWPAPHRFWVWRFLAGLVLVYGTSVVINLYPLYNLFFSTPQANQAFTLKWGTAWTRVQQSWRWTSLPTVLFVIFFLMSFFHPDRTKRRWAWMCGLSAGPVLGAVFLILFGRSNYPISDRYIMSYIAPVFLAFLLGVESAGMWVARKKKTAASFFSWGVALFLVINLAGALKPVFEKAKRGLTTLGTKPMNYSATYQFFEKVKSFQKPTLVLHNQCWLSIVPNLYMRYVGSNRNPSFDRTYNIAGCGESVPEMNYAIHTFLNQHRDNGVVAVFFHDYAGSEAPPLCAEPLPQLHKAPQAEVSECHAIYEAKELEPWIRAQYVGDNPPIPQAKPPAMSAKALFVRKKLVPTMFYVAPGFFFLGFVFVWRRFHPSAVTSS